MIKKLLFLILISTTTIAFSQKWDTKERNYSDGIVAVGLVDLTTYNVSKFAPWGKNVKLSYDPYFKKYYLEYLNDENKIIRMSLIFKESNQGGEMYIDQYSPKKEAYFITDEISSERKVTLVSLTSSNIGGKPYKLMFVFDDLK